MHLRQALFRHRSPMLTFIFAASMYLRKRWRWVIPAWALMCYLILYHQSSQAVEKQRDSLATMCDERARMIQFQLNVSMSNLQALAILVSTFHHSDSKNPSSAVDQTTFARYVERTVFERPAASAVVYGVRVTHSERQQLERQQGWSIKKINSSTSPPTPRLGVDAADAVVREPAEEYAPIIFAQDAYKGIISFDLLSAAEGYLDNVHRARESGKPVLTAPLKLHNNRLGVISTYTVYKYEPPSNARPKERIHAAAIGYLGGIFDIEALVDKLLHKLAGKQSIMVNVYDTTSFSPLSMYGTNDTGSGMCHVSKLNFGDPTRKHEMHCRFIRSQPWPWMAIATSIGTLVIGLLIGYIILVTVKRIARVEDDYHGMTVLKKRAVDRDIAKSQFLDTISHEIISPMNGVLGMLQMLMDTDLETTQQQYVRTGVVPNWCCD